MESKAKAPRVKDLRSSVLVALGKGLSKMGRLKEPYVLTEDSELSWEDFEYLSQLPKDTWPCKMHKGFVSWHPLGTSKKMLCRDFVSQFDI